MSATQAQTLNPSPTNFTSAPWMLWTGRVLSAVPVLMMFMSAGMKLAHHPKLLEGWTPKLGYPESLLTPIGILEILCAVVYLVPRTAVLGAILITGYFGGVVASHLRIGEGIGPVMLGVFAWAGLYLRDSRVRALIPLRQTP
jgi:hypothetical protein